MNFRFIFDFSKTSNIRFQNLLSVASIVTMMFVGDLALALLGAFAPVGLGWLSVPKPFVFPAVLFFALLGASLAFDKGNQFWLVRNFGKICLTPFYRVSFPDFFLADQLQSLSIVLSDFSFSVCFFLVDAWNGSSQCLLLNPFIRPTMAMLPSLWRMLQCLRRYHDRTNKADRVQLANAGKYFVALCVTICSLLRALLDNYYADAVWIS